MSTPIERAAIARELRAANARLAGAVVLAGAIAALMVGAGRRLDAARRHAAVALNRAATQLEESDEQLAAANEQLAAVEQLAAAQPTPAGMGPLDPDALARWAAEHDPAEQNTAAHYAHEAGDDDDQAPDVEPSPRAVADTSLAEARDTSASGPGDVSPVDRDDDPPAA